MSGSRLRPVLLPVIAVAAITFLGQIPWALPGVFLWDDVPMLAQSDLYTSPARWVDAVSLSLGLETSYWRPLATTTFMLESLVHGGSASGFRITAALLHAASAATAFVLLRRLLDSPGAALLAAFAWALHPAHVETVTWIAGRFDLLAGLCILVGLTLAPRLRWVGVMSAMAFLSKESGAVFVGLVVLWSLVLRAESASTLVEGLRQRWKLASSAAIGVIVVVVVRFERGIGMVPADWGEPLDRMRLVGRTTFLYARNLVLPWGGVGPAHHIDRPIAGNDPLAWIGLVVLVVAVALAIRGLMRRTRWGALLAALLLSLAPVLQIVPLDLSGELIAADRYLYVPSFFFVALVAHLVVVAVRQRSEVRTPAIAATCAVLVALGVTRVRLVDGWSSNERFWSWAAEMAPRSEIPLMNLHAALVAKMWPDADRIAEAEETARRIHALSPSFANCHELADVLLSAGRPREALGITSLGLKQRSRDARLLILHGRGLIAMDEGRQAALAFNAASERARGTDPVAFESIAVEALAGRAEALFMVGEDRFAAEEALEVAETRFHAAAFRGPSVRAQILRALLHAGHDERALELLGDGSMISPGRWSALLELAAFTRGPGGEVVAAVEGAARGHGMPEDVALLLRAVGNRDAERWSVAADLLRQVIAARESVEANPSTEASRRLGDAIAWDSLGYVLYFGGDAPAAEEAFAKALDLDPSNAEARMHRGALLRNTGRPDEALTELERALDDAVDQDNDQLVQMIKKQIEETRGPDGDGDDEGGNGDEKGVDENDAPASDD